MEMSSTFSVPRLAPSSAVPLSRMAGCVAISALRSRLEAGVAAISCSV
ncbi:Uncharacterised protein [Bordetella pertussis]|nr:Uncharacterised protein [Bordetella pertussis]